MMTTRDTRSERDVVYEFALSYTHPDPARLDEYVRRYPAYTDALTTFAVELAIDVLTPEDSSTDEPATQDADASAMLSRAMSRFQNRLYEVRTAQTSAASSRPTQPEIRPRNPFSTCSQDKIRTVVERLDTSPLFLMRLRDCGIREDTMTIGFIRRVAEVMEEPETVLTAHFAARSSVAVGQHFRSEARPTAQPKLTFEEAVRSSGLTPEQQARLLSL